jgi:hypothetical protein
MWADRNAAGSDERLTTDSAWPREEHCGERVEDGITNDPEALLFVRRTRDASAIAKASEGMELLTEIYGF